MGSISSTLTVKLVDDVSGPAKGAAQGLNSLDVALKKASADMKALNDSGATSRFIGQIGRLGLSSDAIGKVSASWKDYSSAAGLAARSTDWTRSQAQAVRAWESTMVTALRHVAREERELANKPPAGMPTLPGDPRRLPPGFFSARAGALGSAALGGFAGIMAGHEVKRFGEKVFATYKEFDDLVRYQRAILGMSEQQQKPFIDQALKLGGSTPFNDLQVLHAQLDLAQRGVKEDFIRPIVQMASGYAQAMNAPLPEAAKTIEGILFSTHKNMENEADAMKAAQRAVDFSVKLAKIGGLDNEDVKAFFKFAGLPGSTAGLTDESIGAMAALMRRSNVRGDEAGVAVRAIASHLVAPTNKGRTALAAMGIDYSKYTKMPEALSVDTVEGVIRQSFGKSFTGSVRDRMRKVLSSEEIVGDQGKFVEWGTKALEPLFQHSKNGKLKPQDARSIAKVLGGYYKMAVESVDSDKLLHDIIAANPTLQQSNALFGDKQGSRFMAVARDLALFEDYVKKLREAPEHFADKIGEERMAGFSGSVERAGGALKNFETRVGRATDSVTVPIVDAFTGILNSTADIPPAFIRLGAEVTTVVAGLAALKGVLATYGVAEALTGKALPGAAAVSTGTKAAGAVVKTLGIAGLLYGVDAAVYESMTAEEKAAIKSRIEGINAVKPDRKLSRSELLRREFNKERDALGLPQTEAGTPQRAPEPVPSAFTKPDVVSEVAKAAGGIIAKGMAGQATAAEAGAKSAEAVAAALLGMRGDKGSPPPQQAPAGAPQPPIASSAPEQPSPRPSPIASSAPEQPSPQPAPIANSAPEQPSRQPAPIANSPQPAASPIESSAQPPGEGPPAPAAAKPDAAIDAAKGASEVVAGMAAQAQAADAGAQSAAAFGAAVLAGLRSLKGQVQAEVDEIMRTLNFTATPTISPRIAPVPGGGGSSGSGSSRPLPERHSLLHGTHGDYGIGGIG